MANGLGCLWLGVACYGSVRMAFACGVWAYYAFRRMTQAGINDLRRKTRSLFPKGISGDDFRRRFQRE